MCWQAPTARHADSRNATASATIGHFFHDMIHEFAHVDGKIFRTLQALFFQPGRLTEEYWRTRLFVGQPIRLFLIIVALQALVSSGQGRSITSARRTSQRAISA